MVGDPQLDHAEGIQDVNSTSPLVLALLSARSAQRAHYLDLIQIYTGLGDESDIDLILMHLPRVASDRERTQ
jgi:hypothetical protein